MLKENQIEAIKEAIRIELLKRGFTAPITLVEREDDSYPLLKLRSEPFQTVPVIFKEMNIMNFGGNIEKIKKTHKNFKNEDVEVEGVSFVVPVSVGYTHFDLGSNSSSLFYISGYVIEESDNIFDLRIK